MSTVPEEETEEDYSSDEEVQHRYADGLQSTDPCWPDPPKDNWKNGRVLVIDLISSDNIAKKEPVTYHEFGDPSSLETFHDNSGLDDRSALRIIHVQNAKWARDFYTKRFPITSRKKGTGTFRPAPTNNEKLQQKIKRLIWKAEMSRPRRDPSLQVKCAGFACDYLGLYETLPRTDSAVSLPGFGEKSVILKLKHYDKDDDQPNHGYDLFTEQFSVYVQSVQAASPPQTPSLREDIHLTNEDGRSADIIGVDVRDKEKITGLEQGNAVIIFTDSANRAVDSTLLKARKAKENRWRKLADGLPRGVFDHSEAVEWMDMVLKDVFDAMLTKWRRLSTTCAGHVGILEAEGKSTNEPAIVQADWQTVYQHPTDEKQATELWKSSAEWMAISRLMYLHRDVAREMRTRFCDLFPATDETDVKRLGSVPEDFEKLIEEWDREVVQRTAALSDFVFKTVAFRDSQDSLQFGLSMWRLSWITFIFLPLTFSVGLFGMSKIPQLMNRAMLTESTRR